MLLFSSDLADWLVNRLPEYGSVSYGHASRLLRKYNSSLTRYQIDKIILLAVNQNKLVSEHGGFTLRRVK